VAFPGGSDVQTPCSNKKGRDLKSRPLARWARLQMAVSRIHASTRTFGRRCPFSACELIISTNFALIARRANGPGAVSPAPHLRIVDQEQESSLHRISFLRPASRAVAIMLDHCSGRDSSKLMIRSIYCRASALRVLSIFDWIFVCLWAVFWCPMAVTPFPIVPWLVINIAFLSQDATFNA